MNFRAYDIYTLVDSDMKMLNLGENIYNKLNLFPKIDEGRDSFAPINMTEEDEFIFGSLAQSHYEKLTTFLENSKNEEEIDADRFNDKTYFYIDRIALRIFIQGKLYPTTLSKLLTLDRLSYILSECVGNPVKLIPAKIEYTNSEIQEIFATSYVKRVEFKNLLGLKIPEGTRLHNPRINLDESLAETWNTYNTIDTMILSSKENEQLSKNPIAKIGMELSKDNLAIPVFKSMDIMDSGQKVTIKPSGNEFVVISMPKKDVDDPYLVYEKIKKKVIR